MAAGSISARTSIHPNKEKFKELILYIAQKEAGDPLFGAVKLNKILFYSDFYAFLMRGKPITGVKYQHLERGPAPRMLLPVKKELIERRKAAEASRYTPGGTQNRLIALVLPDLSAFEAEEIAIVDQVIEWLRGKNAEETSELSHLEAGWRLTKSGEDIPYETVVLDIRRPASSDFEWARAREKTTIR